MTNSELYAKAQDLSQKIEALRREARAFTTAVRDRHSRDQRNTHMAVMDGVCDEMTPREILAQAELMHALLPLEQAATFAASSLSDAGRELSDGLSTTKKTIKDAVHVQMNEVSKKQGLA